MSAIIERRISFNAGEISPWLDPRVDLDKYRAGCRTLRNMRPTIYGGAFRRPGSLYLGEAAADDECRLVPFVYERGTTYVLELTDEVLRVWTTGASPALVMDGGSPFEEITPWAAADLRELHFAQQNDVMFVTHRDYPPQVIARYAADDWRCVKYNAEWPATLPQNDTSTTISITPDDASSVTWSGATTYDAGDKVAAAGKYWTSKRDRNRNIEPKNHKNWKRWWRRFDPAGSFNIGKRVTLTASRAIFDADHKGSKWVMEWQRDELKATMFPNTATAGDVTAPIFVLGAWTAGLAANTTGTGVWEVDVQVQRSFDKIDWDSYGVVSGSKAAVNALLTGNEEIPCFLRLKLKAKSGTLPTFYRADLEAAKSSEIGIVRLTKFLTSTTYQAVIEFPCPKGDATELWSEAAWSGDRGYPAAITLHQGRLWFGGTKHQPTTIWGSAVDGYEDFRTGAEEDRAVTYEMQSDEANAVRWLCSQDNLIIGTTGAEWVFGRRNGEDVARLRKKTSFGSSRTQARVANESILFIQNSKRKLREFAWSFDRDGFAANDLSMMAEHFGRDRFQEMAIQKNPETVVWMVTSNGDLAGMTYERSQNVAGWFLYETSGTYESICPVTGSGEEDELWIAVKRNGVMMIERFQTDTTRRLIDGDAAGVVYADSSIVRTGSATTTVSGLDHLEGRTVTVLSDAAPHPDVVVSGGEITLQWEASTVVVGLPFTSLLEPTFLETNDPNTLSKVAVKRIHRVTAELWQSLGMEASGDGGVNYGNVEFRSPGDDMDAAPPLFSGIKEELLEGSSERQASVILRQRQPLPMNVLSLNLRYEMNAL